METKRLDNKLTKMCKKSKVVGVNVALFDGEEIIYNYNYGYANKEKGIKSDNDSLYMIGSNTKVITALGILKLIVNVNIKMFKKWKIKMYIFQLFFLRLSLQEGSLFSKAI